MICVNLHLARKRGKSFKVLRVLRVFARVRRWLFASPTKVFIMRRTDVVFFPCRKKFAPEKPSSVYHQQIGKQAVLFCVCVLSSQIFLLSSVPHVLSPLPKFAFLPIKSSLLYSIVTSITSDCCRLDDYVSLHYLSETYMHLVQAAVWTAVG